MEIFWIAPVGQTWPQSVQFSSQYPMRMFMIGVHTPSMPDSSIAGCRTFVGHTQMH